MTEKKLPPMVFPVQSTLDELVREYEELRQLEAKCRNRKSEIASQLKVAAEELRVTHGDDGYGPDTVLEGQRFTVSVKHIETWRMDTKRLKQEAPEVWVQYARKSTSSRLDVKES